MKWATPLLQIGGGVLVVGALFLCLSGEVVRLQVFLAVVGAVGSVCGGLAVLTGGLPIWMNHRDVCDACGEWQGVEPNGRKLLERKKCFGLVTRRSSSNSHGAVYGGSKLGTMPTYAHTEHEWEERVPVIRTVHRYYTKCRYCGAEWEQDVTREVEDFEPDEPLPPAP